MSTNQQTKKKAGRSARSVKKVAARAVKTSKGRTSQVERFVKRNPVRILLGASAIGLVVATLKRFV